METSCTIAAFDGDELTLWDSVQAGGTVPAVVGAALELPPERIRVISPHTGGGFGGKGYIKPHEILAAAAARVVGRPVKLHLRRSDQFTGTGYQPWMKQDIALGVDQAGRLTALRHHILNETAVADTHWEPSTDASKSLYAWPALETRQRIERINTNVPSPLRAPVEGPGLWALESAMNEVALLAGMDPLDVRLANYAEVHPETGKPWSSKKLREAYQEGARLYGWRERDQRPRQDGPWRIGHGMATCTMGTFRFPGHAIVRLRADGRVIIESNVHDIGTGTQTILAQIAAAELGVPVGHVSVRWGDTRLPATGPVYGSSATMHTGGAVALACRELCRKLRERSSGDPLAALRAAGLEEESAEGRTSLPGEAPFDAEGGQGSHALRTFGAVFLEVGVDPQLGLVRLRRAVGAYSVGRIINPQTARSQMTGGMIWGWGKATMEETVREPAYGRWLAKNLSNVAIPVNADIPSDITIHFVDEVDPRASVLGSKGIGELGATGVDAAVAAAVYDAVGVRVRELPITPAKIVERLAEG